MNRPKWPPLRFISHTTAAFGVNWVKYTEARPIIVSDKNVAQRV